MRDHPRSPNSDFHDIFGLNTMYKFVSKWNTVKSPKKAENEAEAQYEAEFDAYRKSHKVKKDDKEPSTAGQFQVRSAGDRTPQSRLSSFMSKCGSRRSHTPSPRSSYVSETPSRRSKTPSFSNLSRSHSKRVGSSYEAEGSTRRGRTTSKASDGSSRSRGGSISEIDEYTRIDRSKSRRSPIIFSQTTGAAKRKPPPVERKLSCTLEELCHGSAKNVMIKREIVSDDGTIREEEELIRIRLKPGWRTGTKITLEGKGDQKPGYLAADIIFQIEEKRHPLFRRERDDLEIGVEVPLVHALTGCSLTVPLLGGKSTNLAILDEIIYPGLEKVIKGQGMPNPKDGKRGDLKIRFLVEFPTELSDEQRSELFDILQDCS